MFKLISITNSTTGVPFPIQRKITPNMHFYAGCAYSNTTDGLTNLTSNLKPYYVTMEEKGKTSDTDATISCYQVTPDMEFECKCSREELDNIKVGARVNLDNDSPTDCCLHFDPEGDFVITDTLNAKENLLIRVRLES